QTASSPVYSAPPRTPIPPLSLHDALPIYPLGRTVTGTDNAWFTLLTQNTAPIHFDHHYAAQTSFGRPLVNSCLTLALVTGQSVTDVSQNVMANLAWDEVRLPNPAYEGDTVYARSVALAR